MLEALATRLKALGHRAGRYLSTAFGARSLRFFETLTSDADLDFTSEHGQLVSIDSDAFKALGWKGNPYVFDEATEWSGVGHQDAIVYVDAAGEARAFCWLETGVAQLAFLDVSLSLHPSTCYISRVWVEPSHRGTGVGKLLLASARKVARHRGMARLLIACVPTHRRMIHLLSSTGWTTTRGISAIRTLWMTSYAVWDDRGGQWPCKKRDLASLFATATIPQRVEGW